MISEQKRITVHGQGTSYCLTAFKFNGQGDKLLEKAGFGTGEGSYIGIIHWGPNSHFYFDTVKGYAPHATGNRDPILNAAVNRILQDFDILPSCCHIEVTGKEFEDWNQRPVEVSVGFKFR